MTRFKKIISTVLGLALVPATMANAATEYATVSRSSSDTQTYSGGGISLKNYYDYGTWLPGDDAYISATVSSGSDPYAYIYYKPYNNSGSWTSKGGSGTESVYANPSGVDYLQGGSYALSKSGSTGIQLKVVD